MWSRNANRPLWAAGLLSRLPELSSSLEAVVASEDAAELGSKRPRLALAETYRSALGRKVGEADIRLRGR